MRKQKPGELLKSLDCSKYTLKNHKSSLKYVKTFSNLFITRVDERHSAFMFLILSGICVAAPLEIQVVKDIFLSIYVPYSVVRGEQIELKGSVYNHKAFAIKVICVNESCRRIEIIN